MNMKLLKKILTVVFMLAVLINEMRENNIYATETTHIVTVYGVVQAKSNWCWAASAEMAGKVLYPTSGRNQWSAVHAIYGTTTDPYPNYAGTLSDSVTASEHIVYNNYDFYSIINTWLFSQLDIEIENGHPVQTAGGYYSGNIRMGGHMVVTYLTRYNSSSDTYYIGYVDPFDGNAKYCTYDAFCDGTYNGRTFDQVVYTH
jgi:hypothetical protein